VNLFVGFEKYDQISGLGGYRLDSSDIATTSSSSFPCTMHDMIQSLQCNSTILESFKTFQELEVLQLPLMVMLGYHNPDEITK